MLDIAIIGGGLSGLALAQHLHRDGRACTVFESRDRFGGRILSLPATEASAGMRHDLGPSWIWPEYQPQLAGFTAQHGIEVYPHWVEGKALYQAARDTPPRAYPDHETYGSSRRIEGGAYRLVEALLHQLPGENLRLEHHLQQVIDRQDHVELRFSHEHGMRTITAKQVVITVPPRLLADSVTFTPPLDDKLHQTMRDTPTWMAGHAKAVILYQRPFWREAGLSGNALAGYPGAAMAEVFDACSRDGHQAALSGFLALPAELRDRYRDDLDALILEQLVRLFGAEAAHPQEIVIQDWFTEPLTATPRDAELPRVHPTYGHPWLQLDHWTDKLHFAGTETASEFGGYLEGALVSAERVAASLLQ